MKFLFTIFCACLLFSCTKSTNEIIPESITKNGDKENCSFNISEFSMTKRPMVIDEYVTGKKNKTITIAPPPTTTTTTPTPTPTPTIPNVIFLDFYGHVVSNTSWNVYGNINCAPANLTETEIENITKRVATDYAAFNVLVTTDETIYDNANPFKRMRVVITESWEWYGQAGGVAFLNSFKWGNNTPCFVFSSLLGYSTKKIAEASSHEIGHTLGLRHQSVYDATGLKTSEYNSGNGAGEIGWAPIMGASYSKNLSLWHNGPNSFSSNSFQDDVSLIANVLGYFNDDYPNSTSNATVLSSTLQGLINSNNDEDFFSINIFSAKNISVIPQNVGLNNEGGNLDLVLNIYSSQGVLISTINDPNILSASTTLSAGSYFLAVSTFSNSFTNKYGMLSRYSINLN